MNRRSEETKHFNVNLIAQHRDNIKYYKGLLDQTDQQIGNYDYAISQATTQLRTIPRGSGGTRTYWENQLTNNTNNKNSSMVTRNWYISQIKQLEKEIQQLQNNTAQTTQPPRTTQALTERPRMCQKPGTGQVVTCASLGK
jgi:hypothetical protein